MHKILLIAKRDYLATVRTKAFLFGLIIAPILFSGGLIGLAIKDKPDTSERRVAVLDRSGQVSAAIASGILEKGAREMFDKSGRQVKPRYTVDEVRPEGAGDTQLLALSDRVRRKQLYAIIEVPADVLQPSKEKPRIGYYTNAGGIDEMRRWFFDPVNDGILRARLAQAGVDRSRLDNLLRGIRVERLDLVSRDPKTGAILPARKKSELEGFAVPFSLMMLLGMIVLMGASPMLTSVTEDKGNRIFEMLLVAATPLELMAGKVLAAVGVSLTSSAIYVAGGTFALQGMGMIGLVPFSLLPWFYCYLLADMVMLCSMACALGSACSSPQDAQSLNIVLIAPVILPMMLMMPVMTQPNGLLSTVLSLVPPLTPLVMLMRQAMPGGVPFWQPWVGLAGVLACAFVFTFAAARIFRIGILMQGKTPKPAQLLRWALRG